MKRYSLIVMGAIVMALISMTILSAYGSAERVALVDRDFDGMDDDWEGINGLDNSTNDANGDLDEDGMTNIEEFLEYTDPTNEEDSLVVKENRMLAQV